MSTIGHNNPPDPIDEALAPYADAIAEVEGWLDGEPIDSDGQLDATTGLHKTIKQALKDVKLARDNEVTPLHDAWKAGVARWKPTLDDLDRMAKGIVSIQSAFKRQKIAEIEAAKRKAWQEVDEARRAAEKAAREASAGNIEAQREAEAARQAAMDAEAQASKQAKAKVGGMRTARKYEITDHRAALHWIAKNDKDAMTAFIEGYVGKNHKSSAIDGVKTWTEKEAF
jgi:uncharacterized membrane protein